ncbi:helix-turn-helix domain-containing protein [Roseococcus microcysteis]|uniref:helix-turn-helix domain-containing protein n=1 Tax=Roseococcus microcysteis TaxID=2771361 RepID=UPI00168B4830|nr:helix-turn-helix transcriptional regulator [Roseococcus microcysteis]
MDHVAAIAEIERRLVERGVSVSSVCREAGLDRATWHRWKHEGVKPRLGKWEQVQAVVARVLETPAEPPASAPEAA